MSPLFAQFCEQVCLMIRWKAAREPVADELAAHLEDHAAALMERGTPEEEAAQQAVAAMGDPEALGRQLNRAHPPLLHLSVLVTNIVLALLFIAFSFALISQVWNAVTYYRHDREFFQEVTADQQLHPMDEWVEIDGLRLHFFAASRDEYMTHVYFSQHPDSGWLPNNSTRLDMDIVQNVPGNVFYRFVDDKGRSYRARLYSLDFTLLEQLPDDVERLWLEGDVFNHTFRVEIPMDWGETS